MTKFTYFFRNPLVATTVNHIVRYPTPENLNYFWSYGSLAGLFLVLQIITGVLLAMHYVPNTELAFYSVEHIMRNVNYGWLLRYAHANGASFFFIATYLHIARSLYYQTFLQSTLLWYSGVIIFILMMAAAFLGYILPWGQMSFWGATVITNIVGAIPVLGPRVVQWLWGGFAVGNPTLNRFFSLHYIIPIVIAAFSAVHLVLLHMRGSSNPLGVFSNSPKVAFYPYFALKDALGFFIFFFIFGVILLYAPNLLGHSDNYILANPIVTPAHIVPEWYFLPFYAILRACPNKIGGVVSMGLALAALLFLPLLHRAASRGAMLRVQKPHSARFWVWQVHVWFFFYTFLFLGWLGGMPAEGVYIIASKIATVCYFILLLLFSVSTRTPGLSTEKK